MVANEVLLTILPNRNNYEKTVYLLSNYRYLKLNCELSKSNSDILSLLDKAIESIKNEPYSKIIKLQYEDDFTIEDIAEILNTDTRTIYRNRKKLIKNISVILYGDKAL